MADAEFKNKAEALGVTIEASYTVGEYDILILSAEQSNGLITWLKQNDYRIPDGAESVVNSYLKQDMKFFVAKVNLEEQAKLGFFKLATDSGCLRKSKVHAADQTRYAQRRWCAGTLCFIH